MAPLPPPEPSKIAEKFLGCNAGKLRFEINRYTLPKGLDATFGLVEHPGAALAVPIMEDGSVIILRQYRFAVSTRLLEFPAGTLDPGESPLITIKREIQEESGFEALSWYELGTLLPCPGYSNEIIHLFLARDLREVSSPPTGDLDEDIEVLRVQPDELDELFANGDHYLDAKSVSAWSLAKKLIV